MSSGIQKIRNYLISQPIFSGALLFIVLCLILSVFTFLITADKTPQINEQIPAISLKNPGFKVTLLKPVKSMEVEQTGTLKALFFGRESNRQYIPVNTYDIEGDTIYYQIYDEESVTETQRMHLAEIIYGRDGILKINNQQGVLDFTTADLATHQFSIDALQALVADEYIEKRTYWLGTDLFGRSLGDRLMLGLRYSIFIGLLAVLISISIGTVIGMVSGYFGGKVDELLSYVMNVFWSIPTLILVFAIVLVTGRGIQNIFLAVGLTMWVDAARLVRGQVLALKKEMYIESVKAMGLPHRNILFRHILPNMLGPLIVIAVSNFASAIILESGLSYLGFGIQPPAPSLGSILSENYGFILTGKPMLALSPVILLLILVLSFNLVGNKVRDIFDVKSQLQP